MEVDGATCLVFGKGKIALQNRALSSVHIDIFVSPKRSPENRFGLIARQSQQRSSTNSHVSLDLFRRTGTPLFAGHRTSSKDGN